tara:strand:+ start:633 stop:1001 length:369 start_codon:yes stop_codon:yes gene_type:complete
MNTIINNKRNMDEKLKYRYDVAMEFLFEEIQNNYDKWCEHCGHKSKALDLKIKPGRKFDRIMDGSSAWGFVAKVEGEHKGLPYKVGDVFKPATWRQPAKHVRGNIFNYEKNWFRWTGPHYLK